jgi:dihydrofolate reductase
MIPATLLVRKEILAHGEASIAQSFARGECVDEYRLTVFPYLTGAGRPLFADATEPHPPRVGVEHSLRRRNVSLVYCQRR